MKKVIQISAVIAVLVCTLIGLLVRPAKADQRFKLPRHDVVVLAATPILQTYSVTNGQSSLSRYAGYNIYNADVSAGSPNFVYLPFLPPSEFPNSTNTLSQTLANYMDEGFTIQPIPGYDQIILVRTR